MPLNTVECLYDLKLCFTFKDLSNVPQQIFLRITDLGIYFERKLHFSAMVYMVKV
jgi:hypothetical protein